MDNSPRFVRIRYVVGTKQFVYIFNNIKNYIYDTISERYSLRESSVIIVLLDCPLNPNHCTRADFIASIPNAINLSKNSGEL